MKQFKDLTIQIVLYEEDKKMIFNCLNNLKNFKIIILDNSANKKLKDEILENFKIERYILEKKNLGYSRGHNKAASYVSTEYLLILTADCMIDEVSIINLLNTYKKYKDCGLITPTTYNEKNELTYNGGLFPENGNKDKISDISVDMVFNKIKNVVMH